MILCTSLISCSSEDVFLISFLCSNACVRIWLLWWVFKPLILSCFFCSLSFTITIQSFDSFINLFSRPYHPYKPLQSYLLSPFKSVSTALVSFCYYYLWFLWKFTPVYICNSYVIILLQVIYHLFEGLSSINNHAYWQLGVWPELLDTKITIFFSNPYNSCCLKTYYWLLTA